MKQKKKKFKITYYSEGGTVDETDILSFMTSYHLFNLSEKMLYGELGLRLIEPIKIIVLISAKFKTLALKLERKLILLSITSMPLIIF